MIIYYEIKHTNSSQKERDRVKDRGRRYRKKQSGRNTSMKEPEPRILMVLYSVIS